MSLLHLNLYAFTSLSALIFNTVVGLVVWRKATDPLLGKHFGIVSLGVSLWIGGCFGQSFFGPAWAEMFDHLLYTGVCLGPTLYLHFLLSYTNSTRKKKRLLTTAYSTSAIFLLINWTPVLRRFLVADVVEKYAFRSIAVPGPLWFVLVGFYAVCVYNSLSVFLEFLRQARDHKKNQTKYFLIAYGFICSAGALYFGLAVNIETPPIDNLFSMIYGLLMCYALLKHRLLDIRILVRRAGLIGAIYMVLVLLAVPIIYFFYKEFLSPKQVSMVPFSAGIFFVSGLFSLGPFLYAYFIRQSVYFHEDTLAGITHELKSPLAAIESAVSFLSTLREADVANKAKRSAYLDMIQRNSERLSRFVNDLLYGLQHQRPIDHPNVSETNLKEICDSTVKSFRSLAAEKSLRLKFHTAGSDFTAWCDPVKIEQILSNLLSNAMKFSSAGDITVRLSRESSQFSVAVRDNGSGITPADLPYVFDRFFQGRHKHGRGTGLGLTLAKTWVEAHGGKIWAESEGEGRGTEVTFTLPV